VKPLKQKQVVSTHVFLPPFLKHVLMFLKGKETQRCITFFNITPEPTQPAVIIVIIYDVPFPRWME